MEDTALERYKRGEITHLQLLIQSKLGHCGVDERDEMILNIVKKHTTNFKIIKKIGLATITIHPNGEVDFD